MYTHEYALLAVVAIPFLAVVGLNVYLWWGGERGTLLMPGTKSFPALLDARDDAQETMPAGYEAVPVSTIPQPAMTEAMPANDVHVREAA